MSEVVRLHPVEVGEGYRFESDEILEAAKANNFECLAIIGQLEDGSFYVAGTANAGETLIMLERAKRQICFGDSDQWP